jgi:hypothetical protein
MLLLLNNLYIFPNPSTMDVKKETSKVIVGYRILCKRELRLLARLSFQSMLTIAPAKVAINLKVHLMDVLDACPQFHCFINLTVVLLLMII